MTQIHPHDIHSAGDRAAHYRRRLAIVDGEQSVASLMERISFVATRERPTKDPNWWIIGIVVDCVVDGELLVYFNPATKAVKVQKPLETESTAPRNSPSTFPHALNNKGVGASRMYRYFYQGQEYSPDEAAQLVKKQGTQGLTWVLK